MGEKLQTSGTLRLDFVTIIYSFIRGLRGTTTAALLPGPKVVCCAAVFTVEVSSVDGRR